MGSYSAIRRGRRLTFDEDLRLRRMCGQFVSFRTRGLPPARTDRSGAATMCNLGIGGARLSRDTLLVAGRAPDGTLYGGTDGAGVYRLDVDRKPGFRVASDCWNFQRTARA